MDGDESSSEEEEEVEDDDEHDWMTEAALGANPDDQEYKALRALCQEAIGQEGRRGRDYLVEKDWCQGGGFST